MFKVLRPYYEEGKRRAREAARGEKAEKKKKDTGMDLVEAVFKVIPAAREHASSGGNLAFGQRRFYYAVRRLIQPLTTSELKYSYFQKLVQRYLTERGPIEGLYFEPRGTLYEPHTNKSVGLGTREVAAYRFPEYVFDKILFVEKAGQWPLLKDAKLAERYDMAIVAGEGFASEAARVLFDKAEKDKDYQLFVLHDADHSGYEIARTLQEETERMPGYSVDVIDLGLTVQDAVDMDDVEPEDYVRKSALSEALLPRLNNIELEHFSGEQFEYQKDGKTKTAWQCQRYELDAMTSGQAIEYIEKQLKDAEVRPKVIPPPEVLPDLAEEVYREQSREWARSTLDELLGWDDMTEALADEFIEQFKLENSDRYIRAKFKKDDSLSWGKALRIVFTDIHQKKHTDSLKEAVRKKVVEALEEAEDGGTP